MLPHAGPEHVSPMYGKTGLLQFATCGLGPSTAALFTNPMEVAKVRLQMQTHMLAKDPTFKPYKNFADALVRVQRAEGWGALQAGLQMAVVREGCKCSLRLGLYKPVLDQFHSDPRSPAPMYKSMGVGAFCGAMASLSCNPLDLTKTRMQQKTMPVMQCIRQVVSEGGVKALWKGTSVSIYRSILAGLANAPIKYRLQSMLKEQGFKADTTSQLILRTVLCSFPSAACAVAFMQPMDTIRTRLYNQPTTPSGAGLYYKGMTDCFASIVKKEGPLSLWQGSTANFLRFGPHSVLGFVFIDLLQLAAREYKASSYLNAWETEVESTFNAIDSDNNGYLSRSEVVDVLKSLFHTTHTSTDFLATQADKLMIASDSDHDGRIDRSEFLAFETALRSVVHTERLDTLFEKADYDQNMTLSIDELTKALLSAPSYPGRGDIDDLDEDHRQLRADTLKAHVKLELVDLGMDPLSIDLNQFHTIATKFDGDHSLRARDAMIANWMLQAGALDP